MKIIFICTFLCTLVFGNELEKYFWDEVKNSSDIEMLKSYKKQYPQGVFERLADIKIKRLQKNKEKDDKKNINKIPVWIKGTAKYKYYGIGKANKHFKGKYYQENLAKSRAKRKLQKLFDQNNLTNEMMEEYYSLQEKKKYVDHKGRVYILIYIDDYNIY